MPGRERARPQPEEGQLTVLYEDDWLIGLDKPAGLVVHPTYRNTSGTLLNALLWRLRGREGVQPGLLTRLDKDTSGVVVAGLTPAAHAAMQRDMAAGRVRKEYLAIVAGVPDPPRGRIVLPLGRDTADRRRVVVREDGQRCETVYEVVRELDAGARALVRCELVTGRTHQIRVHLAARGWPVVGDRVYGLADARIARQALHACRVTLPHPATREVLVIESAIPGDIRALI